LPIYRREELLVVTGITASVASHLQHFADKHHIQAISQTSLIQSFAMSLIMMAANLRALKVVQAADVSEGLVLPLLGILEAFEVVDANSVVTRNLPFYTVQTLQNIPGVRPDDLPAVLLLVLQREVICQVLADQDILLALQDLFLCSSVVANELVTPLHDFLQNLKNCLEIKTGPLPLLQICRWLPPHRASFGPATSHCRLCKSVDNSTVLGSVEDLLNWICDAADGHKYRWNNWLQGMLLQSSVGMILIEEHHDGLDMAVMGNINVFTGLICLCVRSGDVADQALHICDCLLTSKRTN
jgi:hypothetical protein